MADAWTSLNGLVTINDQNVADFFATNILDSAPLVAAMAAIPASNGTQHKYVRTTTGGSAGFRAIGAGISNTAEQGELVTDTLKFLDATVYADVAAADGYGRGVSAYLEMLLEAQIRAAMWDIEQQIILGTNHDASGFSGFDNTLQYVWNSMVIDGGDTGSDLTKVYAVRTGPNNAAVIAGNDGRISVAEEPVLVKGLDGSSDPYLQWAVAAFGYFGLQLPSTYDVAAAVNLASDSTTNGVSDDVLASLIAKFPAGRGPNLFVMNRSSWKILQDSRTATNPTGAPAPFPESAFGVPIVVTDAITDANSQMTTTTTTTTTTT